MATTSYPSSTIQTAVAGPVDVGVTNAARVYLDYRAHIVLKITGTEAKFTADCIYGNGDSNIQVSVDGSAFGNPASRAANVHTLFTGLSDTQHTVLIRCNVTISGAEWFAITGNVLDVTGASPALSPVTNWVTVGDVNADSNAAVEAATGWTPNTKPRAGSNSGTYGPNISSLHVLGAYTTLNIVCLSTYVFVSVDGAEPTEYTLGTDNYYELTGLSGTHEYYVWASESNTAYGFVLGVGGNVATTAISPKKRLDVFGSSTVRGNAASKNGLADVFRVAAYFGYVGCSHGADGDTFASLATRIVAATSAKTYNANDVAYVAIGRNDVYGNYNGTGQTNFNTSVTRLSTIYSKVIVRGLLPSYTGGSGEVAEFTADNLTMAGWVTTLALSNVYYVDPIALNWSGIDRPGDTVHPNDAGYTAIVGYEKRDFAGYLGAAPATGTSACTVWMI
jgi:hypothetical protein